MKPRPPAGTRPEGLFEGARAVAKRVLNPALRDRIVPALRAYIRFMPTAFGKRPLWEAVIAPHFGWLPHEFEVTTRLGSRMKGNTEDFIQRHLYYFGLWEPDLTNFLASRLRPGDVFVDVGANVGYFTLEAAKLVGVQGAVVAVEPSPVIFERLQGNIALNNADNVRAVNMAAADCSGMLRLYHGPADNQGGTTLVAEGTPGATFECEVPAEPLSAIVTPDEWRRTRVVKIDVEGAEAVVARGLAPLLDRSRDDLEVVIEIAPRMLEKQGRRAEDVMEIFRSAGFHAYRLENEYSADRYLQPNGARRLLRITEPLVDQTDVVFSRINRPVLL